MAMALIIFGRHAELDKMIIGPDPARALSLLAHLGLFEQVFQLPDPATMLMTDRARQNATPACTEDGGAAGGTGCAAVPGQSQPPSQSAAPTAASFERAAVKNVQMLAFELLPPLQGAGPLRSEQSDGIFSPEHASPTLPVRTFGRWLCGQLGPPLPSSDGKPSDGKTSASAQGGPAQGGLTGRAIKLLYYGALLLPLRGWLVPVTKPKKKTKKKAGGGGQQAGAKPGRSKPAKPAKPQPPPQQGPPQPVVEALFRTTLQVIDKQAVDSCSTHERWPHCTKRTVLHQENGAPGQ